MNMAAPTGTPAAAFLAAIIADPADNSPRLMYADWLTEQGESARSEFIRVQCALAKHETAVLQRGEGFPAPPMPEGFLLFSKREALQRRERELLGRHEGQWLDWLKGVWGAEWIPTRDITVSWRRGFVAAITLCAEAWLQHADALLKTAPLEEVTLTTWPEWVYGHRQGSARLVGRGPFHSLRGLYGVGQVANRLLSAEWPRIKFNLPPSRPRGVVT
jgi:uncharacterized protein (TIGR02996 family)